MDPVHSFTYITFYCKHCLLSASITLFYCKKYHLPHDTFNPMFSANRWDWQPHCKLGQSILVVLCAGSTLLLAQTPRHQRLLPAPLPKSASYNFRKWFLSPIGQLNLGFILRENLLLCSSYLPLGVSQLVLWNITPFPFLVSRCQRGRRVLLVCFRGFARVGHKHTFFVELSFAYACAPF
jgi:hypothetical protein